MVSSNNVLVHYEGKLIVRPLPINLAGESGKSNVSLQRQVSNICLLPDVPRFSLVTTFKYFFLIYVSRCCGSESGSVGSVCSWDSWIRIRIHSSEALIRILLSSSKNNEKNLDSNCFVTYF
jgi:hypothetical protein